MAIIFIDIYGRCDLPLDVCSEVTLCMKPEWAYRTLSGFAIAFGRIVAKNKTWLTRAPSGAYQPCCTTPQPPAGCAPAVVQVPAGQCCSTPPPPVNNCCSTPAGYEYCIYQVEIDTEQFLIDPETDTNYAPECNDFLDIMPYPCIISRLVDGAGLNVVDGDSIDLTYTQHPANELTAEIIVDPAVENILDYSSSGVLARVYTDDTIDGVGTIGDPLSVVPSTDPGNILDIGVDGKLFVPPDASETPNAAIDTNSVDLTLSGTLNRTIQADVKRSSNANQAITEEFDGLHVSQSYADTESDAITGDAGAADISSAGLYTIATSGTITVNNPSSSRPLAFKLDGDTNIQTILQTGGVWKIIVQQNINGAGFVNYAEKQYGTFPGQTGMPLDISAGYETEVPAGGSLTIQRRIQIQTVTPSVAGSTAGVYSSDMRALWVTK